MAKLVFDASALAKRYVKESGSPTVTAAVTLPYFRGRLYAAEIISVELAACLAKKLRRQELNRRNYSKALTAFRRDYPAIFNVIQVDTQIIAEAERWVNSDPKKRLDTNDALHLACALHVRAALRSTEPVILVSADGKLLNVGRRVGIRVFDPEVDALVELFRP